MARLYIPKQDTAINTVFNFHLRFNPIKMLNARKNLALQNFLPNLIALQKRKFSPIQTNSLEF